MESPPVLTREQVRRVDALAVERYGMSGLVLMENAGRGVVDVLLQLDPSLAQMPAGPPRGPGPEGVALRLDGEVRAEAVASVVILCGKGNNAGDGFVIARHLHIHGVDAKVLLLFPPAELAGNARANYEILVRAELPIIDLSASATPEGLDRLVGGATWLVDAMLGTGATGEPRELLATVISWMNEQPARRLAVDVPSGLDCDTGAAASATVRADVTCTFVAMKPGFVQPQARPFVGEVRIVSIGVPPRVVDEAAAV